MLISLTQLPSDGIGEKSPVLVNTDAIACVSPTYHYPSGGSEPRPSGHSQIDLIQAGHLYVAEDLATIQRLCNAQIDNQVALGDLARALLNGWELPVTAASR